MAGSIIANKCQFRKILKEFGEGSHANWQNTNFCGTQICKNY